MAMNKITIILTCLFLSSCSSTLVFKDILCSEEECQNTAGLSFGTIQSEFKKNSINVCNETYCIIGDASSIGKRKEFGSPFIPIPLFPLSFANFDEQNKDLTLYFNIKPTAHKYFIHGQNIIVTLIINGETYKELTREDNLSYKVTFPVVANKIISATIKIENVYIENMRQSDITFTIIRKSGWFYGLLPFNG